MENEGMVLAAVLCSLENMKYLNFVFPPARCLLLPIPSMVHTRHTHLSTAGIPGHGRQVAVDFGPFVAICFQPARAAPRRRDAAPAAHVPARRRAGASGLCLRP